MSKYVVVHPKLHSAVGGSTKLLNVGDLLELTDAQAERLGAKVKRYKQPGEVDLAKAEADAKAKAEAEKSKRK